jgi:hypothetical protein
VSVGQAYRDLMADPRMPDRFMAGLRRNALRAEFDALMRAPAAPPVDLAGQALQAIAAALAGVLNAREAPAVEAAPAVVSAPPPAPVQEEVAPVQATVEIPSIEIVERDERGRLVEATAGGWSVKPERDELGRVERVTYDGPGGALFTLDVQRDELGRVTRLAHA